MPVAKPVSSLARVIAHVDMDCFYVQVEQRKQPQLRGLPAAVVQYNEWKGGGLIAVSYEARKHGVKRSMRGDEAKSVCPQIHLVQVPVARGKADLSSYRDAGSEVVSILARKGRCERASIDEVYLDLTDAAETMLAESPPESLDSMDEEALKSHIFGINEDGFDVKENVRSWLQRSDADHNDKLLSCGALIVTELRMQVLKETEFTCSAGIANNKMLAKLASGLNKPAQQTIVPSDSVKEFLGSWPIKKMKQLGGKLGDSLQIDLGVYTVGELLPFSKTKLQEYYGFNTGTWLWNIARGVSGEEVQGRLLPKSHGSGKTFPGPRALRSIERVSHWLQQLCEELSERLLADLDQNKRIAHTLTLHVRAYKSSDTDSQKKFPSKSCPLRYGALKIQEDASSLFHAGLREYMGTLGVKRDKHQNYGWGVTSLSISASKIVAIPQGTCTIKKYFPSQCPVASQSSEENYNELMQADMQLSGSDCVSEGNLYTWKEKSAITHDISDLDQNEEEKKSQKVQTAGAVTHLQEQGTYCSFEEKAATSYSKGQSTSSLYEQAAHAWSILDQSTAHKSSQLARKAITSPKIQDQELRNPKAKGKGTPSILSFLSREEHSSSQSKHQLNGLAEEINSPIHSEGGSMVQRDQSAGNCVGWSYNVDEIDPTIVEELPLDIQQELSTWILPQKQFHQRKRSSITSYFLPSKVSRQ